MGSSVVISSLLLKLPELISFMMVLFGKFHGVRFWHCFYTLHTLVLGVTTQKLPVQNLPLLVLVMFIMTVAKSHLM